MITQKIFNLLVDRADKAKELREDIAGIENAVQDYGTYDDYGTSYKEVQYHFRMINEELNEIADKLHVPEQFLECVLDSSVINRWDLYNTLIGKHND